MMSIRLRLTLIYTTILALTLIIFGAALYTVQSQYTLDSLKRDLRQSSDSLVRSTMLAPDRLIFPIPAPERVPPMPFESFSEAPEFQRLREREIVRVLDSTGALVASPFGLDEEALPLSEVGLQTLQELDEWWEIAATDDGRLLIYNRPVVINGRLVAIVQVARSLAERDRTLAALGTTLIIASLVTTLSAFAIGWALSGITLRPIKAITQTAQAIGIESDFTRRVDYIGPHDEIGELATTFNSMLARLENAYQRVSQTLKLQREFVADVSHELRTPLTTVRGNLALLNRQPPLPDSEQVDVLTDLVEESDRLIRLVNDLLIMARADAGRGLTRRPVAVRPVVEESCRLVRQSEQEREIVTDIQDVTVQGDRDALKQVILILLDNALKYSQGVVEVTVAAEEDQAIISVQDHGPGIEPEALEHIFERFYRGDRSVSAPGFGLGLPIARALVEAQGGAIMVASQPGEGSRVSVRMPKP
jgi:two-component system, OmpR family, sensor kinase